MPEQTIIKWEDEDSVSSQTTLNEVKTTKTSPGNIVLQNDILKAMPANTPIDSVNGIG